MNTTIQNSRSARLRDTLRHSSVAGLGHLSAHSRRQLRDAERRWVTNNWRFIAAFLTGTAVASLAVAVFVPTALGDILAGIVLASGWWYLRTFMIETTGSTNNRLGLMGETWTSMELAGARGWAHVNDLSLDRGQIDHVAIGPGGCVVVESKFRNDWTSASLDLDAMAAQVECGRGRMASFLQLTGNTHALVAMWGNGLEDVVGEGWITRNGVIFCRGAALKACIESLPKVLDEARIREAHTKVVDLVLKRDAHDTLALGPAPIPWSEQIGEVVLRAIIAVSTPALLFVSASAVGITLSLAFGAALVGLALAVHSRLSSPRWRARLAVAAAGTIWFVAALGPAVVIDAIVA